MPGKCVRGIRFAAGCAFCQQIALWSRCVQSSTMGPNKTLQKFPGGCWNVQREMSAREVSVSVCAFSLMRQTFLISFSFSPLGIKAIAISTHKYQTFSTKSFSGSLRIGCTSSSGQFRSCFYSFRNWWHVHTRPCSVI